MSSYSPEPGSPPSNTHHQPPAGRPTVLLAQAAVLTAPLIYQHNPRLGSDAGRAGGVGSLHPTLIRSRQR